MTVSIDVKNSSVFNLLRSLEAVDFIHLNTPVESAEDWFENGGECPLCAVYHEPNEQTIAAFEEGDAMERGEIPAKRFHSAEAMWADLRAELRK
jgi:hypothetical protein